MAQELGGILSKARREGEERDAQRRATKSGLKYIELATMPVEVDALDLIPETQAKTARVAVIEYKNKNAVLAVSNPDESAVKTITKELETKGLKVKIVVVSLTGLQHAWEFYKFVVPKTAPITGRIDIDKDRIEALEKKLTTPEFVRTEIQSFDFRKLPTAQVLEIVLAGALANRVSDIHFEPAKEEVKLRYRIDGDLHDVMADLGKPIYSHLSSRIKLLANLKLNVLDEAQDGRISIGLGGKDIELRVAVAPSEFGEVIVMRVLDPDAISLGLTELGLRKDDLEIIKKELNRPNGMILNTGPTGSGKTTTLYAFLKDKYSPEIKIITIEDPIEYHLPGIEQTQVDPKANYTFANGLLSLMRQDPDVILIGEVRDKEPATIAIQAALTGHLVFSTVHANQAAGAIPRLVDLGVKPTSIGPALNLIIAQRLVKRLCPKCKVSEKIDATKKTKLEKLVKSLPKRVDIKGYLKFELYQPKGCKACGDSGYRGRVAIYELLQITKEVEKLMSQEGGEIEIQEFALRQGMVTMQQDGVLKALEGVTTLEEVEKITGPLEI